MQDDYRVVYEVSFEPEKLYKARLEFWLTDSGHVSVGVETYTRLARRLSSPVVRRGMATGCEPGAISRDALVRLFRVVTHGSLVMTVSTFFGVITSPKLYMPEADFRMIVDADSFSARWFQPISDETRALKFRGSGKVLLFEPW
ncbi:hypothetical protein LJ725_11940 [Reyranella aquatilis]|uniref:Uncharacterized protein n=1 Tax=Reyranella aquatilis TaxID=2035356 RepID=A0ABS8KUE0_9HYPH|nr:hypothetical protein [Reyranella aquatilis]